MTVIIVICSLKEKKPVSLKPIIKMSSFPFQFIYRKKKSISEKFGAIESREVSFK